ncbi:hypothetical protein GpartN1_g243.t1 [Galdieria partita]|uniref:Phosphoribulokinase/uridine kinase domain-containing protein n=1 Tax=Galdieria partita TaxID=83374 RepID=A0A9C7UMC3_9RHOD|nr:hypothetical protein GpartN1_g243.t1 [Galdieria partita]
MNLAFGVPCRISHNKNGLLERQTVEGPYRVKGRRLLRTIVACPQFTLTVCSLEKNVERLKGRILEWLEDFHRNPPSDTTNWRFMIGLVGVPGSGKTTLAARTAASLNSIKANTCTVVPMDGFHYSKKSLDEMECPAEAHARRGAPWTFDSQSFVKTILKLRRNEAVFLPSFDHHKGDPDDDAVYVDKTIPIVLVEGNYLLLPDSPWNSLSHILDEIWYLDCDIPQAMSRVFERMVNEVGRSPGEASFRVSYNDRRNAELISRFKCQADVIIDSRT